MSWPLVCALLAGAPPVQPPPDYRAAIEKWRGEREAGLKADEGWLTLAGLHWLSDGVNRFGSAPDNAIVLPPSAPAHAGEFEHGAGRTQVRIADGGAASAAGQPVQKREMAAGRKPDVLQIGPLSMFVIQRGERWAVRVRDKESENRRSFKGLSWFPIDERHRVVARFVPPPSERRLWIPNVLGGASKMKSPGTALFELHGRELGLDAVLEGDDAKELFFIFRDETAGKESYASGRFLYAALPKDGKVILDFNKAVSPPCAYTPYATCPLPPEQNVLPVRIEAGERFSGH